VLQSLIVLQLLVMKSLLALLRDPRANVGPRRIVSKKSCPQRMRARGPSSFFQLFARARFL